jgi:uncharacterized membrane protein
MTNIISNIGDIVAIPLFALSTFYFYNIQNKNKIEYILFLFSIGGLLADIIFTYSFLLDSTNKKINYLFITIIILIIMLFIAFNYDNNILI